jgi:hypothetical protein
MVVYAGRPARGSHARSTPVQPANLIAGLFAEAIASGHGREEWSARQYEMTNKRGLKSSVQ